MYVVLKVKKSNMYFCGLGRHPEFTERIRNAILYETKFDSIDELNEELNSPSDINQLVGDYYYLLNEGLNIVVEEININEL